MNCDIIRDLLPLYAEGLASDASKSLIEEHTETCAVCRGILRQMQEPIEAANASTPDPLLALRRQKKKNRRRAILACVITALVILFGWWIYMETHFVGETPVTVSTDSELILSQVPDLALTDGEKELSFTVFTIPSVKNLLESEMLTPIPYGDVRDDIGHIIPPNAHITEISAGCGHVYIDYTSNGKRVILHYVKGSADKTITIPEPNGKVDTLYEVRYSSADGSAVYQKVVLKHIWFGFLQVK